MFMEVCNPNGIFFVSLLAANRSDVLRMSQSGLTERFQNFVDRNPVLASGLHVDINTLII